MTQEEIKRVLFDFKKWIEEKQPTNFATYSLVKEYIYDYIKEYVDTLPKETPEWSDRKKATFAFFDKLPDGLREMAKENYTEIASTYVPTTLTESVGHGFLLPSDALNKLFVALSRKSPSITLNGITYDLTKCYE